jgi:hypothetical protein
MALFRRNISPEHQLLIGPKFPEMARAAFT